MKHHLFLEMLIIKLKKGFIRKQYFNYYHKNDLNFVFIIYFANLFHFRTILTKLLDGSFKLYFYIYFNFNVFLYTYNN